MKNNEVVDLLIKNKLHISFAESLTGGLLASCLVEVPNASKVLDESFVTYSDDSKIRLVGVSKVTIEKYTVYSEEVAYEMCKGLNSEVGVSATGVAGPTGGTKEIPVGTVCFGIKIKDQIKTYCKHFNGSRNEIREQCVQFVFDELYELLK